MALRNARRDANEMIKDAEKDGDISEDDSRKGPEKVPGPGPTSTSRRSTRSRGKRERDHGSVRGSLERVSPAEQVPLGERLGKYELLALLAVGGTAEIFLARRSRRRPASRRSWWSSGCSSHLAETPSSCRCSSTRRAWARARSHPNIVQTIDLGETTAATTSPWSTWPACRSRSSRARRWSARGRLPIDLMLGIVRRPAPAALRPRGGSATASRSTSSTATSRRRTSIVTYEGVKVVDFGIAHAAARDQDQDRHDQGQVRLHVARAMPGRERSTGAPTSSPSA